MKQTYNNFSNSHQVLMTLKANASSQVPDLPAIGLNGHADYYKKQLGKLNSYGYCINQQAICIVLNVDNDEDLIQIISNDPQLTSGALEIDVIVPFRAFEPQPYQK